eukprot:Hpha_TRINITY_DN13360_c0_g1::TRINITY_DN13360_c0_g1_i1::g.95163::m.95163
MGNFCSCGTVEAELPARRNVRFQGKEQDLTLNHRDRGGVLVTLAALMAAEAAFQRTDEGIAIGILGDLAFAAGGPPKPQKEIAGLSRIPLAGDMKNREEYAPAGFVDSDDTESDEFFDNDRELQGGSPSAEESGEETESESESHDGEF